MANELLNGKRIYQLDLQSTIESGLRLAVDNVAFNEAKYITIGQLTSLIGHPAVSLGTPNGLHLTASQVLSLQLASINTPGALPALPNNPVLFYNGVGEWVEVSGGGDSFWQRTDGYLSPATANDRVTVYTTITNSIAIEGNGAQAGMYGEGDIYGLIGNGGTAGVFGTSPNYGVQGDADIAGVRGTSNNYGVHGDSPSGIGVLGDSTDGYGTRGSSVNGIGLYGYSQYGQYGIHGEGNIIAIGGTTDVGIGLYGESKSGNAIMGIVMPSSGTATGIVQYLECSPIAGTAAGVAIEVQYAIKNGNDVAKIVFANKVILTTVTNGAEIATSVWRLIHNGTMYDRMGLSSLGRLSVAAGYAVNTDVGISYTDASITIVGGIVTSFTGFGTSDSYGYWVISTFDTETMPVNTNVTTHKVVRFIGDGNYINITHEVVSDEILVSITGIPDGHVTVWNRDEGEVALVPTTITDAVMLRSTTNLGTLTLGETSTTENIVFGIRDLVDSESYNTHIKWFTNGIENDDVLRLGITGTGTSAIANLYTELVRLRITTPYLDLITDYDYSNAFHTEIRRDYAGVVASRLFNSAISTSTDAYVSKIIGVHPSTSNYATVNITVTGKEFAGIVNEWEDNGTGYLKHSANIVTGGTIKPALNIGTRSGQPIRFFVGGASDLDFDNTTLRQVIWDNGNISIGGHGSISTHKAMYSLDTLTGDIRLVNGKLVFGGTIGSADAVVNLYQSAGELVTDNLFMAKGGYKSSDGTLGLTATASFDPRNVKTLAITLKDGLVTRLSVDGGAVGIPEPILASSKIGIWTPPGNATTVPGIFGILAPTITGFTATARNIDTTSIVTRTRRLGYATAATAGAVGHWGVNAYQFTVGNGSTLGGFTYVKRFAIADGAAVSDARMFIGMRNSSTPSNVDPSTLTNCIGVGHNAAHTNLHLFYGGSVAQTPINLGVNFPITHGSVELYELALYASPANSNVSYRVTRLSTGHIATGTIINTGSTVLPTATTLLAPWGYRTNNATGLAVALDVISLYMETNY